MKVLHVIIGLGLGGAEKVLTTLVERSTDIEHVVVSLTHHDAYAARLRAAGATVESFGATGTLSGVAVIPPLARMIRRHAPDVVQTWMYHSETIGTLAARLAGHRTVVWNIRRSSILASDQTRRTLMIAKTNARLSRKMPTRIICCAHAAARWHAQLGYDAAKMVVIPNGIDVEAWSSAKAADLALPDGRPLIGCVARYHRSKDHRTLFEALAGLDGWGTLALVGNGMERDNAALLEMVDAAGLPRDKLMLLGPRRDIMDVMAAFDIHVLSSHTEGFPNVVAEAMAAGCLGVASDVGDADHIASGHAQVVPPRDPTAMRAAIDSLLSLSPTKKRERVRAARRHVREHFGMARMVEAYREVWEDAMRAS